MDEIELYANITQKALEMGVTLTSQVKTLLQQEMGLSEEDVRKLHEQYYSIAPMVCDKAIGASVHNIAYTMILPFTMFLLHAKDNMFTGYIQAGNGTEPVFKFRVLDANTLATHLGYLDKKATNQIWYPDSWYEDQACIQRIVNGPPKKKSLFGR